MDSDVPSVNDPERIQIAQVIERETRAEHWPGGKEQDVRRDKRMQILFVTGERRDRVEEQDKPISPLLRESGDETDQHCQLKGTDNVDHRAAHTFDEIKVLHDF